MNKKQLLVSMVCLVFSGTAIGQFKLVYDSGEERDYSLEEAAIKSFNVLCRMSLATGPANLVEKSTGTITRIDCSTARKMSEAYTTPKQKDEQARAAAVAASEKYKVFSQSKTGAWKAERQGYPTVGKAEAQVKRLCVHGAGTVVAAKIIDQSGQEIVTQCPASK